MSANLLDCTAVAAALFSNHEHLLHLNEHSTFAEIPKLDPAVVPLKHLQKIYRSMVGTAATRDSDDNDERIFDHLHERQQQPRNQSNMQPPGAMSQSWLRISDEDGEVDAEYRNPHTATAKKPGSARGNPNRFAHPNALRSANSNNTNSTLSQKKQQEPQLQSRSRTPPASKNQKRLGNGNGATPSTAAAAGGVDRKAFRASSTASSQDIAPFATATATATAIISASPLESRLTRKAAIVANVVRSFMTHRLYRRQSSSSGSTSRAVSSGNKCNTVWINSGFINMRYSAPAVCGVVGRVLHLAAVKEAEMASVAVARCMELLDAVVVSSDLLQSQQSNRHSSSNTNSGQHNHHSATTSTAPSHVFPVPLFRVTVSRAEPPALDDMSATFHEDRLNRHVSLSTGGPKRYCSVQVAAPAPPFAPPVFLLDLARALVHAGPDALRSYLPSAACCQWVAAVIVPSLVQPASSSSSATNNNHNNNNKSNTLNPIQEHAEVLSPYKPSQSTAQPATTEATAQATTTTTTTTSRPTSLWHSYLEALSFIAGENRAEDVAEFVRAVAAFIVATEIRLVPHTTTTTTAATSSSGLGNNNASTQQQRQQERFTRAANKCGLLPATLRDAQGLQHLADLLQQPSAESLLSTLQAVPTGGRTSAIPYHLQQQSVDASVPHYSSFRNMGGSGGANNNNNSALGSTSSSPLLKIAFVPDTIYRSIVSWILTAVNTRLMRLSCVGGGVQETTRVLVALCETRSSEAMFGGSSASSTSTTSSPSAPSPAASSSSGSPLQHSALPMHLVADAAADCWRRIHCVLERRHLALKRREQRMAISGGAGVDDLDEDDVHAMLGSAAVAGAAAATASSSSPSTQLFPAAGDVFDIALSSSSSRAGIVGSSDWQGPVLLPLIQQSDNNNHNSAAGDTNSSPSAVIRSTAQLIARWPLAGLMLNGIAASVASLRKLRLGSAISHHHHSSTTATSASSAFLFTAAGTIQLQHAHGPVTYSSMTVGSTPCFIISDDDASRRFSATATLYGSAAAPDGSASTTVAAQRWRAGEHRAALEALDAYFATIQAALKDAHECQMDQDFLFLSLGYSHLNNIKRSGGSASGRAIGVDDGEHASYSLLDKNGAQGLDRGLMFVDSTAAQAVAMRFRMDTEAKAPNVPRRVGMPLMQQDQQQQQRERERLETTANITSSSSSNNKMNLSRSLLFQQRESSAIVPASTSASSASSMSSCATAATAATGSAASSTARAYAQRPMSNPLLAAKQGMLMMPTTQEQQRAKSLSVVSCNGQLQQPVMEMPRERDEEPDPAPPTPSSRPLVVPVMNSGDATAMSSAHRMQNPTSSSSSSFSAAPIDWLRFSFSDFCASFFDSVADQLFGVDGLQDAADDVFVAAVCAARGLRPNRDFILLPDEGQMLVAKSAVVAMANLDNNVAEEDSAAQPSSVQRPSSTRVQNLCKRNASAKATAPDATSSVRLTKTGAYRSRSPRMSSSSAAVAGAGAVARSSVSSSRGSSVASSSSSSVAAASVAHVSSATLAGKELISKYGTHVSGVNGNNINAQGRNKAAAAASLQQQEFSVDAFKSMRDSMVRGGGGGGGESHLLKSTQQEQHQHQRRQQQSSSPAHVVAVRDGPASIASLISAQHIQHAYAASSAENEVDQILLKQQQQQQQEQMTAFVHRPLEQRLNASFAVAENVQEDGGVFGDGNDTGCRFAARNTKKQTAAGMDFWNVARNESDADLLHLNDVPTVDFAGMKKLLAATAGIVDEFHIGDTKGTTNRRGHMLNTTTTSTTASVAAPPPPPTARSPPPPVLSPRRNELENEVASLLSSLAVEQYPQRAQQQQQQRHQPYDTLEHRSVSSVRIGSEESDDDDDSHGCEAPRQQQPLARAETAKPTAPRLLNLGLNTSNSRVQHSSANNWKLNDRDQKLPVHDDNGERSFGSPEQTTSPPPPTTRSLAAPAIAVSFQQQQQQQHTVGFGAPSSLASFLGGGAERVVAPPTTSGIRAFYSL